MCLPSCGTLRQGLIVPHNSVFKLVAKGTAEEKIIQAGKRKLVLDHLIVQSLQAEADDAQDVESILQFGAKDLFEQGEGESESDIKYNDADIDKLLDRVETADVRSPARAGTKTFAFARIWERTNDSLREVSDETENLADAEDQRSFWNNSELGSPLTPENISHIIALFHCDSSSSTERRRPRSESRCGGSDGTGSPSKGAGTRHTQNR